MLYEPNGCSTYLEVLLGEIGVFEPHMYPVESSKGSKGNGINEQHFCGSYLALFTRSQVGPPPKAPLCSQWDWVASVVPTLVGPPGNSPGFAKGGCTYGDYSALADQWDPKTCCTSGDIMLCPMDNVNNTYCELDVLKKQLMLYEVHRNGQRRQASVCLRQIAK